MTRSAKHWRGHSDWFSFQHVDHRCGSRDGLEFETGCFQQRAELGFGTLLAAGEGEHGHVQVFGRRRRVARGNHAVRDQKLAIGENRFATMAQNLLALLVGPIVNDVAEEVGVGSGGNTFEKAPCDDGTAVR